MTKASPQIIDEWQEEVKHLVLTNGVPNYLNGNKDETPTKLNVSENYTVDVSGVKDVRFKDQGHLKDQYTTYAGGWAGAMMSRKQLLDFKPINVGINDFTKDGHLLPSLSIFKGKTARTLSNVVVETTKLM